MTAALSIANPFQVFTGANGQPLNDGRIYVGTVGLNPRTNPVQVYFDAAMTIPAAQPIRTINGYPSRDGSPATIYVASSDYSLLVTDRVGSLVFSALSGGLRISASQSSADDVSGGSAFTTVQGFITALLSSVGTSLVGFIQSGIGAARQPLQDVLRREINVFDFLSADEKADVLGRTYTIDVTTPVQNAINAAFAQNKKLTVPAGGYLVNNGLYLPGRVIPGESRDDRGKVFIIEGVGCGEVFATHQEGTVFRRTSEGPVLYDYLDTDVSSNGTTDISRIRFEGDSTGPVIYLQSMGSFSKLYDCQIYQSGTGDGIYIAWSALARFENVFAFNTDWVTTIVGTRTGAGFKHITTHGSGLIAFDRCSARGFATGFHIDGVSGSPALSAAVTHCQAAVVTLGVYIGIANNTKIIGNYFEGIEGTAIQDSGDYSVIAMNYIPSGDQLIGIDASDTNAVGTIIKDNLINISDVVNAKAIVVDCSTSTASKIVRDNYIISTQPTAGSIGLELNGSNPNITVSGNFFSPNAVWSGAGAKRIDNKITGSAFGDIQVESGSKVITQTYGAFGLSYYSGGALTESSVDATHFMTLPNGSYFEVNATAPGTYVNKFICEQDGPYIVNFRTRSNNLTFKDTSVYIYAAGDFAGPGMITFLMQKSGANTYAYEISRTVY